MSQQDRNIFLGLCPVETLYLQVQFYQKKSYFPLFQEIQSFLSFAFYSLEPFLQNRLFYR